MGLIRFDGLARKKHTTKAEILSAFHAVLSDKKKPLLINGSCGEVFGASSKHLSHGRTSDTVNTLESSHAQRAKSITS